MKKSVPKIEKTYLKKHLQVSLVPDGQAIDRQNASSFLMNSSMELLKTLVSNARGSPQGTQMPCPQAAIELRMPHPPGLTT